MRIINKVGWPALICLLLIYGGFKFWQYSKLYREANLYLYVQVSDYILAHTVPEAKVFLEHIGLFGYRTNRYIFDSGGLVTPETVELKEQYGLNWLPNALKHFQADVIVFWIWETLQMTDEVSLAERSWFEEEYMHVISLPESGEPDINIYFRRDSQAVKWVEIVK